MSNRILAKKSEWKNHAALKIRTKKKDQSGYKQGRAKNRGNKINKKRLIKAAIIALLAFLAISLVYVMIITRNLPNPNQLLERQIAQSTQIYDRTGEHLLYEIHGDKKRTLVGLNDIPAHVKQATIAIEDKNFYEHGGFSVWSIVRTMITNVIYNRRAGGSTLTQQFIKNAVLTSEKKYTRKIKEIFMAYKLEKKFSKDEILQMYLNEIPYGSNAYGVEAASQKYFGKSVKDIDLAEAATLAAMIQTPSRYSPYGPNKDILLGRKDYVLDQMEKQGYINEEERDAAKAKELEFKTPDNDMFAPHFVMYIKEILSERYGEKTIEQDGLKIYTTLDYDKQKIAQEIITEKTENYQEKYNADNAALLAIDPKTGQILAMVGSRDYFDDEIDGQVNITVSSRQPGSSFKPIVYSTLFEKGYTPNTILYDVTTNFSTNPAEPYIPVNYNGKEHGPVQIRQALSGSLNIPAVKAIYLAGKNDVIELAKNMGYSTLGSPSEYGLSLALGAAEVRMIDHIKAFSAFPNEGIVHDITGILKVEDKDGKILEEYEDSEKRVITSNVAKMISSVLSDNNARSFIFGARNSLTLADRPVAAKTGTTNDFKDAWTIGYTPSLVAGVWIGNTDNTSMTKSSDGSVVAAPIWNEFMKRALEGSPVENFNAPEIKETGKAIIDGNNPGVRTVKINKDTGLEAGPNTPDNKIEEKKIYNHHSILHYIDIGDPLGDEPKDPSQDPQYQAWETAIATWAEKNKQTSNDSEYNPAPRPEVQMISPADREAINGMIEVRLDIKREADIRSIEYYLNDNLWFIDPQGKDSISHDVSKLPNGYYSLAANVCLVTEVCTTVTKEINILNSGNQVVYKDNSINISSPDNSSTISWSQLPVKIKASVKEASQLSSLKIYYNAGQDDTLIASVGEAYDTFEMPWYPPLIGDYKLFIIGQQWDGKEIRSNEVEITVN